MRLKYGNKKTEVGNLKFDSKKEAKRYSELKVMEFVELIADLKLQVVYPISINGVQVCKYVADFTYKDLRQSADGSVLVVEDCKGMKTPVYNLKKKLMKAVYGIEIKET